MQLCIAIANRTHFLGVLRDVSLENLEVISVAFQGAGTFVYRPRPDRPYSIDELRGLRISAGVTLSLSLTSEVGRDYRGWLEVGYPRVPHAGRELRAFQVPYDKTYLVVVGIDGKDANDGSRRSLAVSAAIGRPPMQEHRLHPWPARRLHPLPLQASVRQALRRSRDDRASYVANITVEAVARGTDVAAQPPKVGAGGFAHTPRAW